MTVSQPTTISTSAFGSFLRSAQDVPLKTIFVGFVGSSYDQPLVGSCATVLPSTVTFTLVGSIIPAPVFCSEKVHEMIEPRMASGQVFRTYSAYARGIDMLNVAYHYLDIVPKGRDEGERGPYWVRRHDEYGTSKTGACH